jgi:uncharacterized damage-inducible protein DinB
MDATLQRLHAYNNWATKSLLRHLAEQSAIPENTLKVMQHIINAESIWTSRISGEKPTVGVWEAHTLQECKEIHQRSSEKLSQLLNTDQDLNTQISYVTSNGDPYTDNMHDILIHVFNHATYHRAQIAKDLRNNGLEPINTDYIQFMRLSGK